MIDVHCHLEQPDFDKDREKVISDCAKQMKAIISSSPYFPHFEQALFLHRKYPKFVFISLARHTLPCVRAASAVSDTRGGSSTSGGHSACTFRNTRTGRWSWVRATRTADCRISLFYHSGVL